MMPKSARTTVSILAALCVGLAVGLLYKPYQLSTSGHDTFKINRLSGSAWRFDKFTGYWVEVPNR